MKPFIRPKILNQRQCEEIALLVNQGRARVIRTFQDGKSTLLAVSASGAPLGSPCKNSAHLLEAKFATHGANDGLFPNFDQSTRLTR